MTLIKGKYASPPKVDLSKSSSISYIRPSAFKNYYRKSQESLFESTSQEQSYRNLDPHKKSKSWFDSQRGLMHNATMKDKF